MRQLFRPSRPWFTVVLSVVLTFSIGLQAWIFTAVGGFETPTPAYFDEVRDPQFGIVVGTKQRSAAYLGGGGNWMFSTNVKWWAEGQWFGRGSFARITFDDPSQEEKNRLPPPFPGRARTLALAESLGPMATIRQKAAGWPLRLWITREYRADQNDPWTSEVQVLWWNGLLALALCVVTALVLASLSQGLSRFVIGWRRRRRGLCPNCGYDRRGLIVETPCPECGSGVERSAPA